MAQQPDYYTQGAMDFVLLFTVIFLPCALMYYRKNHKYPWEVLVSLLKGGTYIQKNTCNFLKMQIVGINTKKHIGSKTAAV
jgi:hypothetical protein